MAPACQFSDTQCVYQLLQTTALRWPTQPTEALVAPRSPLQAGNAFLTTKAARSAGLENQRRHAQGDDTPPEINLNSKQIHPENSQPAHPQQFQRHCTAGTVARRTPTLWQGLHARAHVAPAAFYTANAITARCSALGQRSTSSSSTHATRINMRDTQRSSAHV